MKKNIIVFLVVLGLSIISETGQKGVMPQNSPGSASALPAERGLLETTNSSGRTGAYYLPEGYNLGALPLMLAYHGSGGNGDAMVNAFVDYADEYRFIIVAPDSRCVPFYGCTWEVGTEPNEITEDFLHALACKDEVLGYQFVTIDPEHVLAVGHSGGGSSAPYIATNSDRFTASATLHGGVFTGGLGDNIIPAWFSTGEDDTLRTPSHVEKQAQNMRDAGFPDVEFHVYPGGHELITEEIQEMLNWWIGPPIAKGPPFGSFDTPIHESTVMSSIPVTGWALDDIGVESVKIYRDPVNGEGGNLVYIGDAVFVKGARPDVEQAYLGYPNNYKAGWGYMMLTNFLPSQGNGTFVIHAHATDKEGTTVSLGSKTITCDNAHAVRPFGAIDVPRQGADTKDKFFNAGWALTPMPNKIPEDGSTIYVWVDGQKLGHPDYNQYRNDIAALFPGYENSQGAVGAYYLDTTTYTNGVHTIAWSVADNGGNSDGIGSRFFTIANTGDSTQSSILSQKMEPGRSISYESILNMPVNFEPIEYTRGYREDIKPEIAKTDEFGLTAIEIKEVERIRLDLGEGSQFQGYLIVREELRPLPVGSSLDTLNGVFCWIPGPGFIGDYNLVFIKVDEFRMQRKIKVKVKIRPKFGGNHIDLLSNLGTTFKKRLIGG